MGRLTPVVARVRIPKPEPHPVTHRHATDSEVNHGTTVVLLGLHAVCSDKIGLSPGASAPPRSLWARCSTAQGAEVPHASLDHHGRSQRVVRCQASIAAAWHAAEHRGPWALLLGPVLRPPLRRLERRRAACPVAVGCPSPEPAPPWRTVPLQPPPGQRTVRGYREGSRSSRPPRAVSARVVAAVRDPHAGFGAAMVGHQETALQTAPGTRDGRRLASSTAEKWVQYAPRERLSLDNRSPHKGWAPELGQGISKGWLGIA
jgi:hypothetical protein